MKKAAALLMCSLLTVSMLTACGDSGSGSGNSDANGASGSGDNTTVSSGYTYELEGTTISMGEDMAEVLEALGDADDYFESESCAFQGMDKVYTYGSTKITTAPDGDNDYVYLIELVDDTVETPEGVCIGAAKEDVITAYGDAGEATETALIYVKDNSSLTFILEDDTVSAIIYTADLD